mmetsp:Transcript_7193/g.29806  ORF Transcript_7193/g.29806 Transcript_7193/m.29806 type:complete len:296 (-) Transcript_7193:129-1016(-)
MLPVEHLVDDPVLHRLPRVEVLRSVDVLLDLLVIPPDPLRQQLQRLAFRVSDLLALNLQLGRLPPERVDGLFDHDGRRGQRRAVPLLPARQKHRSLAPRRAHRHGVHRGVDVLHRVVNRKRLRVVPVLLALLRRAGGVDVQVDGLVVVLVLQVQQLREDQLGDGRHQRHAQVHDALLEDERRQVGGGLRRRVALKRGDHRVDLQGGVGRGARDRPGAGLRAQRDRAGRHAPARAQSIARRDPRSGSRGGERHRTRDGPARATTCVRACDTAPGARAWRVSKTPPHGKSRSHVILS